MRSVFSPDVAGRFSDQWLSRSALRLRGAVRMAVRPPPPIVKPVVAGPSGAAETAVPLPTSMLLDLFKATHTPSLAGCVRHIACDWLSATGVDLYLLASDDRTREPDPDAQRLMRRVYETNARVVETSSVPSHTAQVAAPLHVQGLLTGVLIATLPVAVWEREESRSRWTHLLQMLE